MLTVQEFIQNYFDRHYLQLTRDYPGLKKSRLIEEYCEYHNCEKREYFLKKNTEFFTHLKKGYPFEYMNNKAYFYRSNFYVNESVLIPRSETEILVEAASDLVKKHYRPGFSIAEVGIGSFALGLSLLMEVKKPLYFWAGDIDDKVLEVAKINYFRHQNSFHAETVVEIEKSDRLSSLKKKVDLIVSNPPYIKRKEHISGVHEKTLEFDPHLALFLDDEIYEQWFENFFKQAEECLLDGGHFYMEGHEDSLQDLKKIALNYFDKVEIKNDYTQRNRFLFATKTVTKEE